MAAIRTLLLHSIVYRMLFICAAGHAEAAGASGASTTSTWYRWNSALGITSMPYGTGACLWRSPERVLTTAYHYVFYSVLDGQAVITYGVPIPVNLGTFEAMAETGGITGFPHVVYNGSTSGVITVDIPLIGSIAVSYFMNAKAYIAASGYAYYEFTNFTVNSSLGRLNTALSLTGNPSNGKGTHVLAEVPEPQGWIFVLLIVQGMRRYLRRERRRAHACM